MKGFTIIELVIVIAISAALAGFIIVNFDWRSQNDFDLTINEIVAALRNSQNNAATQESGSQWGVHFENPIAASGFYDIFKGASYSSANVVLRIVLRDTIKFNDPIAGSSRNIIFSTVSGRPSASSSIIVSLKSGAKSKTIYIKENGSIEY